MKSTPDTLRVGTIVNGASVICASFMSFRSVTDTFAGLQAIIWQDFSDIFCHSKAVFAGPVWCGLKRERFSVHCASHYLGLALWRNRLCRWHSSRWRVSFRCTNIIHIGTAYKLYRECVFKTLDDYDCMTTLWNSFQAVRLYTHDLFVNECRFRNHLSS